MKNPATIIGSELDFRRYVISNHKNITRIFIFGDILYGVSFFYCFCKDGTIVSAKEIMCKSFSFLKRVYSEIAVATQMSVVNFPDQKFTIILHSEEEKKSH